MVGPCSGHYVHTSHQHDHAGDTVERHDDCRCGDCPTECSNYDCSYTTYSCNSGGSLSGTTCYF